MVNRDHDAHLMAGAVSAPAAPKRSNARTGTWVPRLRRLIRERGYYRAEVCRCLALHENALQRLDDDTWHPRSDTLERIEVFVEYAEQNPEFRMSGSGWRLDYFDPKGMWRIVGDKSPNRRFYKDPYAAIRAAEAALAA